MSKQRLVRIGDLSRATGVPIATLRFYEKEGLIHCVRTQTRYRLFADNTVEIVQRILHLKSLKIPLVEIRRMLPTSTAATGDEIQELHSRLAHVLKQKSVWEEQEQHIRLQLQAAQEQRGKTLDELGSGKDF